MRVATASYTECELNCEKNLKYLDALGLRWRMITAIFSGETATRLDGRMRGCGSYWTASDDSVSDRRWDRWDDDDDDDSWWVDGETGATDCDTLQNRDIEESARRARPTVLHNVTAGRTNQSQQRSISLFSARHRRQHRRPCRDSRNPTHKTHTWYRNATLSLLADRLARKSISEMTFLVWRVGR